MFVVMNALSIEQQEGERGRECGVVDQRKTDGRMDVAQCALFSLYILKCHITEL